MKINKNKITNKNGQSMVEYVILFTVVVAAVVAGVALLQPRLIGLYQKTADVINEINPTLNY